jgi:hypothetical protein
MTYYRQESLLNVLFCLRPDSEAVAEGLGRHIWPPLPSLPTLLNFRKSPKTYDMNQMIWHEWYDSTWMTWFDMNDMIWHEWHDLTWMTWFDINCHDLKWITWFVWHEWHDLFDMNDMIWNEWHDLTWKTWMTLFEWPHSRELAMKAEGTVGAPSCFSGNILLRYSVLWWNLPTFLLPLFHSVFLLNVNFFEKT